MYVYFLSILEFLGRFKGIRGKMVFLEFVVFMWEF